ncbi:uncharacterized protein LOC142483519, partial [Ascaphus truei]|uniref:uncharacterized protein LOC142483519 n=1 Tax=Ascaphus truei TaxID=8439 RepID=UPI003F59B7F2
MSGSEEPMEVNLNTEPMACASGFRIVGGGKEGITVTEVLKESPDSQIFCIKEGDQLLSATIFFDNITYEDALKILQHSESCKVQFHLKRKFGKDEREKMQSVIQFKKEKQMQGKDIKYTSYGDAVATSEKIEVDQTVKKREHKKKRSKKERLSWPKFQSIKNTTFLGHRRSRSTSETNEDETPETSSKLTEAHFQEGEIYTEQKKEAQYQREFPGKGMELHSRKVTDGEHIAEIEHKKVSEPHRRSKEKRSLDSSINVRVDHHGMPKSQLKKGLSFNSSISSGKGPGKAAEWQDDKRDDLSTFSVIKEKCPEVEVIIVKEKNLPSPCTVSPIPKKDRITTAHNVETTVSEIPALTPQISQTQLSTTEVQIRQLPQHLYHDTIAQGQQQVYDDTASLTQQETEGGKHTKTKLTKATFEIAHPSHKEVRTKPKQLHSEDHDINVEIPHAGRKGARESRAEGADWSLNIDAHPSTGINTTQVRISEAEQGSTSFKPPKRIDDAVAVIEPQIKTSERDREIERGSREDNNEMDWESALEAEDYEWKFKIPVLQMPSFGISEQEESDIKAIDLPVEQKPPEQQPQVSGWKFQMPIIKMPKLPRLHKKLVKSEDEDQPSAITVNIDAKRPDITYFQRKDSVVKVDAPISTGVHVEVDHSLKTKMEKADFERPGMQIFIPEIQVPAVGLSTAVDKTINVAKTSGAEEKQRILSMFDENTLLTCDSLILQSDLPVSDLNLPTSDTEKRQTKTFDISILKRTEIVNIPAESTQSEVEVSTIDMISPDQILADKAVLDGEDKDKTKLTLEYETKYTDIDAGSKEGVMRMPKFKMPSFSSFTRKGTGSAEEKDGIKNLRESSYATAADIEIKDLDSENIESSTEPNVEGEESIFKKTKMKIPKVGVSLPQFKGHKGHYSVSKAALSLTSDESNEDQNQLTFPSAINDIEEDQEVHVSVTYFDGDRELKVPGTKECEVSSEVLLNTASMTVQRGTTSKIDFPHFQMPKLRVAALGDSKIDTEEELEQTTVNIHSSASAVDVNADDMTLDAPLVETISNETNVDSSGYKIKMPSSKMPTWSISDKRTDIGFPSVDTLSRRDQSRSEVGTRELEIEGSESTEIEEKESEKQSSSFKMPTFKLPSFGFIGSKVKTSHPVGEPSEQRQKDALADLEIKMPITSVAGETTEKKNKKTKGKIKKSKKKSVDLEKSPIKMNIPEMTIKETQLKHAEFFIAQKETISLDDFNAEVSSAVSAMSKEQEKTEGMEGHVTKVNIPSGYEVGKIQDLITTEIKIPSSDELNYIYISQTATNVIQDNAEVAEITVHFPHFLLPNISAVMPEKKEDGTGEVIERNTVDISSSNVAGNAEAAPFTNETSAVENRTETSGKGKESSGWKIQMPSIKMPTFHKSDKKTDINVSSLDTAMSKKVSIVENKEKELNTESEFISGESDQGKHESPFKLPSLKLPSLSLVGTKGKTSQVVDEASTGNQQVLLQATEIDTEIAEIIKGKTEKKVTKTKKKKSITEMKSDEVDIHVTKLEGDMCLIKQDGSGTDIPSANADITVEKEKSGVTVIKGMLPKVKMPKLELFTPFSTDSKLDMEVSVQKPDTAFPPYGSFECGGDIQMDRQVLSVDKSMEVKVFDTKESNMSTEVIRKTDHAMLPAQYINIQFPHFQMPKIGVIAHDTKQIEVGKRSKVEIPFSQLAVDTDIDDISVEGEVEKRKPKTFEKMGESSGFTIQMPAINVPKLTQSDGSVSSAVFQLEKDTSNLGIKERTLEIKGGVGAGERELEKQESSFKLPAFTLPTFGWTETNKKPCQDIVEIGEENDLALKGAAELESRIEYPDFQTRKLDLMVPEYEDEGADINLEREKLVIPVPPLPISTEDSVVNIETSEMDVIDDSSNEQRKDSSGWKIPIPTFKMPTFSKIDKRGEKPKTSAQSVDITFPPGKSNVDETTLETENVIRTTVDENEPEKQESSLKLKTFKMPLFGRIRMKQEASQDTGIVREATHEKTPPALYVNGSITDTNAETSEMKGKKTKSKQKKHRTKQEKHISKSESQEVSITTLQKGEIEIPISEKEMIHIADVEVEIPVTDADIEKKKTKGMKGHMPKVKIPKLAFSTPFTKDAKVKIPDCTLPDQNLIVQSGENKYELFPDGTIEEDKH